MNLDFLAVMQYVLPDEENNKKCIFMDNNNK